MKKQEKQNANIFLWANVSLLVLLDMQHKDKDKKKYNLVIILPSNKNLASVGKAAPR